MPSRKAGDLEGVCGGGVPRRGWGMMGPAAGSRWPEAASWLLGGQLGCRGVSKRGVMAMSRLSVSAVVDR